MPPTAQINFRVKYNQTPEIWANASQVQDISKLTNLVPKQSLIFLLSMTVIRDQFSQFWNVFDLAGFSSSNIKSIIGKQIAKTKIEITPLGLYEIHLYYDSNPQH